MNPLETDTNEIARALVVRVFQGAFPGWHELREALFACVLLVSLPVLCLMLCQPALYTAEAPSLSCL